MRKVVIAGSLAASGLLLLAGCGDGGGSVASTPAPVTTTAPPASAYTRIVDLTGSQSFVATLASTIAVPTSGLPSPQGVSNLLINPVTPVITYNDAAGTYSIQAFGVTDSFTQANLSPSGDPKAVYLEQRSGSTITASLRQITPSPGGIDLSYVRYGVWYTTKDTVGPSSSLINQPRTTWLVGGIYTKAADVPTSGSATYGSNSVIGSATEFDITPTSTPKVYDLSKSTASFSANFAANTVQTQLNLVGTPVAGGGDVTLGSFSGSGTIGAFSQARTLFEGQYTGVVGGAEFKGAFYGPAAAEFGYGYLLNVARPATGQGSSPTLIAAGAVAGKQ